MRAASRAPVEKDTRKMVIDMPTAAPALRPAVAGSGIEPVVEGCRSVRACGGMHNITQVHKYKLSVAKKYTEDG